MAVREIPGAILERYLDTVRVPVEVAEGLAERVGASRFTPTIPFDAVTGTIRESLGTAIGDTELVERGRRTRLAADERARAIRLRAEADALNTEAQQAYETRREQAARLEDRVEEKAEERLGSIEQRHEAAERKAAQDKARKKASARKAAQAREEQIARKERDERLQQLERDEEALAQEELALTAQSEAQRLEDAATKVKAARKRP